MYSLQLIEWLIEHQASDELKMGETEREGLNEYLSTWQSDFIAHGGFDQLYKIFIKCSERDLQKMDIINKKILSVLLKIFKTFLLAVFASEVSDLYRTSYLLGIADASVEDILEYLENEHLATQKTSGDEPTKNPPPIGNAFLNS
jgi:hypothetical protein